MKENLRTINELHENLKKLEPFKQEDKARLDKKFRLEFNYNSNHLEGNTLTYGETELLLIFGETKGNHTLREYQETKAHDAAFSFIEQLASDKERPLTEHIIKQLNEIILVEPFWKEALTPDGQNTRRKINIGNYKAYPNSVRLQNGEIFEYASVTDTPILMRELMDWYRENETKLHPIELATLLHYKFVRIHPFDDGNGRISRLLLNYVLLKNGFPPVIIKSADKTNYLRALHNADVGDFQPLLDYIEKEAIWSLKIAIKAGKGEDLEENDDFIKEIELIKRKASTKGIPRSPKIIFETFEVIDSKVWKSVIKTLKYFSSLFNEFNVENSVNHYDEYFEPKYEPIFNLGILGKKEISTEPVKLKIFGHDIYKMDIKRIGWHYEMLGLKGSNPIKNASVLLELFLNDYNFNIYLKFRGTNIYQTEKSYNDILLDSEIEEINKTLKKHLLDYTKQNIN
jgi:Fic family protein